MAFTKVQHLFNPMMVVGWGLRHQLPGTVIQKTLTTVGKAGTTDGYGRSVLQKKFLVVHGPDIIRIDQKAFVAMNHLLPDEIRQGGEGSVTLNGLIPKPEPKLTVKAFHT